jgi:hypothetical protein
VAAPDGSVAYWGTYQITNIGNATIPAPAGVAWQVR